MRVPDKTQTMHGGLILIPVDFSPVGEVAISHGIELAIQLKYQVCLLHIVTGTSGRTPGDATIMVNEARQAMNGYRKACEERYGQKIKVVTRKGTILQGIRKAVRDLSPTLMVMGTHGKSGLQHLFGSYALKLVLDSTCPVLVVQERPFGGGYRNIVLPVGIDLDQDPAFEWMYNLCQVFGSDLHLYACPDPDPLQETEMQKKTLQLVNRLEKINKTVRVSFASGRKDFDDSLIRYSESVRADLLLITTVACGKVPGFEFSGWIERMIFNPTHIPVLCVNNEG